MLPELKESQNVYVEITNPVHGGPGWEFGSCLWSPVKDKGGAKAWKLMEKIQPNDIILHLLKLEEGYTWAGISLAETSLIEIQDEPPIPGKHRNMSPYQLVMLSQFVRITPAVSIDDFFTQYENQLRTINRQLKNLSTNKSFFIELVSKNGNFW